MAVVIDHVETEENEENVVHWISLSGVDIYGRKYDNEIYGIVVGMYNVYAIDMNKRELDISDINDTLANIINMFVVKYMCKLEGFVR